MAIVLYIEGDKFEKNGIKFDMVKTDLHCMKTYLDLGYKKSLKDLYPKNTGVVMPTIEKPVEQVVPVVEKKEVVKDERPKEVSQKPFEETGKKTASKKKTKVSTGWGK